MTLHYDLTPLDYLLILEGLILVVAGVFITIAEIFGKGNENDELKRIMRRFWREMIFPSTFATMPAIISDDAGDESPTAMFSKSKSKAKPGADPTTAVSTLNVKVVPGSSQNQIAGRLGDAIKVQVTAQPEGGEANKAVIDLLAESLGIPGWKIKLIRGHYDSRKVLQISSLTAEEVDEKLAKFL